MLHDITETDAGWLAMAYWHDRRERMAALVARLASRIVWCRAWVREAIEGAGRGLPRRAVWDAETALQAAHVEHRQAMAWLAAADAELAAAMAMPVAAPTMVVEAPAMVATVRRAAAPRRREHVARSAAPRAASSPCGAEAGPTALSA